MKEFESGAVRDVGGKGRMDLLPWCAIRRLSVHMEQGNDGHGERNWEKGIPIHCFLDSAFRHMSKYMEGFTDEDHLCAAVWNLTCAMWMEENRPDMQDIPSRSESLKCHQYGQVMVAGFKAGTEDASPRPEKGSSLRSKDEEDRKPAEVPEAQEKSKEMYSVCVNFHSMAGSPRCAATKNMESCYCNGDISKCDHMYD